MQADYNEISEAMNNLSGATHTEINTNETHTGVKAGEISDRNN